MEVDEPDQSWTYEQVAAKARSLRTAVEQLGIRLHRDSALATLLREAEALARDWEAGRIDGGIRRLVHAAHANRVSDAIETARSDAGALECIRRMCANSLDLSGRGPSQGKDALWELWLALFLKRRGIEADHADPPDLLVDFGFGSYPIACKKVYTERGIESQVRSGARQLERHGSPGLVAINFDDLAPPDALLRSASRAEAADYLTRFNQAVIDRNRARLQRFVADGRCDGILVSTTALTDIVGSTIRFNTHTQTTLWTLSPLSAGQAERVARIRSALEVKP